jgi:L-asparagine transporter-like permease
MVVADRLAHSLQPRHVTMISLGGIIGAGIFVGSSAAINIAGPSVLFTYAMCGALVFIIMRMLGEMAVARPGIGSFSAYAALGLGPWAGFVTGWLYFYFWIITIAVEALAGAKIIEPFVPLPVWATSAGLIALMTGVNLMSVRTYGECEFWFATGKVLTILAFISIGLFYIFVSGPGVPHLVQRFAAHGGLFPTGWPAVFTAIPVVIFSMMGSEVATIAAAETEYPAQNVVRAGRTVSLRILFFYVGSIAVIVSVLPWDQVVPAQSPFTAAFLLMRFPKADLLMSSVVFTAVVSCLNSAIYVTSRMLFEMAQRGDAPARFGHVSSARVPRLAILTGSIFGFAVVASSILSPGGIFVFLLQSSGAIILSIYMLIALSQISLRRRMEEAGEALTVKVWLFPYISYLLVGGILAVFVLMAATTSQMSQIALSTVTFIFATLVYFFWWRRAAPSAKPTEAQQPS